LEDECIILVTGRVIFLTGLIIFFALHAVNQSMFSLHFKGFAIFTTNKSASSPLFPAFSPESPSLADPHTIIDAVNVSFYSQYDACLK
jgi:hypothetical protein